MRVEGVGAEGLQFGLEERVVAVCGDCRRDVQDEDAGARREDWCRQRRSRRRPSHGPCKHISESAAITAHAKKRRDAWRWPCPGLPRPQKKIPRFEGNLDKHVKEVRDQLRTINDALVAKNEILEAELKRVNFLATYCR